MSLDGFEKVRAQLPPSFSSHHEKLLRICFAIDKPNETQIEPLDDSLGTDRLRRLSHFVALEFAESMKQQCKGRDESEFRADPNPYDVFLMEINFDTPGRRIAVCLPTNQQNLAWYNGGEGLIPLNKLVHKWRIASLSGPARVLKALSSPSSLTKAAMSREQIIEASKEDEFVNLLEEIDPAIVEKMNRSQLQAIATIISPRFSEGFFVIQGPPGCGKTHTIVHMVSAAVDKMERLLVTAPSNAAVANVASKLVATGGYKEGEIVVYGRNCDPSVLFLSPSQRGEALKNQSELQLLSSAKVVLCTVNAAGSSFLRRARGIDTVLMDEAGQVTEAEFCIATNFPGVRRIIVVGDPQQLSPTVISRACSDGGYANSWMAKVQPSFVHLLDTQYRMDPEILAFPNKHFYRNRIKCGPTVFCREPFVERPFLFVDTSNLGYEERDSFSFRNVYECCVVKYVLRNDKDIVRVTSASQDARVLVIAPYLSQVKLLKQSLRNLRKMNVTVATVDSFQGQEADIVLVCTVRTKGVGFVGNKRRLNVALTRASRVSRVIGDASFFGTLGYNSTLRALSKHAHEYKILETTPVESAPSSRPDWSQITIWKPVMNARFCDCVQKMTLREKNLCMNTLLAVCAPKFDELGSSVPERTNPTWYESFLKGYGGKVHIVWIAKDGAFGPVVEVHFAGNPSACNSFRQRNANAIPAGASIVRKDLSGIMMSKDNKDTSVAKIRLLSWPVKNTFQNALYHNPQSLPHSCLQLDPFQESIARLSYPVLIESRSGTGKTLVLQQHAAYHSDGNENRPACFVTVSPRLCNQLRFQYAEMQSVEDQSLRPTLFFSYEVLLDKLTKLFNVTDYDCYDPCRFHGFMATRKSKRRVAVEAQLVENEIGGVIMGSMETVKKGGPLSRDEYLSSKRSNVENKCQDGLDTRQRVYDLYQEYTVWKKKNLKYDVSDLVLRLLRCYQEKPIELFSSGYLDEVQDLSYAAIYLICSLAGRSSTRWLAAGDPAQMISPGCSFTFAGLKQTLLAIRPGIESSLNEVQSLHVNYRTTKDVLDLANSILEVIKRDFPGSISCTCREKATKDLGKAVVLCSWDTARSTLTHLKLGADQALIFSSKDPESFLNDAKTWLDGHPLILSTLESKGLEFDDILVVFDLDRNVWKVGSRAVSTLRMLRELYVAVTRARRRVIILSMDFKATSSFFESLSYSFESGTAALNEFLVDTPSTTWRETALEYFKDGQFSLASRCFKTAHDLAWSDLSKGHHLFREGCKEQALSAFESAIFEFNNVNKIKEVLKVALWMVPRFCDWSTECREVVMKCIDIRHANLPRADLVRLSLRCNNLEHVTVDDFKNVELSVVFRRHRRNQALMQRMQLFSSLDIKALELCLPEVIGDVKRKQGDYDEAVRLYLKASDIDHAMDAISTNMKIVIADAEHNGRAAKSLTNAVAHWLESKLSINSITGIVPSPVAYKRLDLLFRLFRSTEFELLGPNSSDFLRYLGRTILLVAVSAAQLDHLILHKVHTTIFFPEVTDFLRRLYAEDQLEVLRWYLSHNDHDSALLFARDFLPDNQLMDLVTMKPSPDCSWLYSAISARNLAMDCLSHIIEYITDTAGNGSSDAMNGLESCGIKFLSLALTYELQTAISKIAKRHADSAIMFRIIGVSERSTCKILEQVLPEVVGDAYRYCNVYLGTAVSLFMEASREDKALSVIKQLLDNPQEVPHDECGKLLLCLFQCPRSCLFGRNGPRVLSVLGRSAILLAMNNTEAFHSISFMHLLAAVKKPGFDKSWRISCSIRGKYFLAMIDISMEANLPILALEISWTALGVRDVANKFWAPIYELWQKTSEEILQNAFGVKGRNEISLFGLLFIMNPFAQDFDDEDKFFRSNYGPGLAQYVENSYGSVTLLKPDGENVRSTDSEPTISLGEGPLMRSEDTISAVRTNDAPNLGRSYRDVVTSGGELTS